MRVRGQERAGGTWWQVARAANDGLAPDWVSRRYCIASSTDGVEFSTFPNKVQGQAFGISRVVLPCSRNSHREPSAAHCSRHISL